MCTKHHCLSQLLLWFVHRLAHQTWLCRWHHRCTGCGSCSCILATCSHSRPVCTCLHPWRCWLSWLDQSKGTPTHRGTVDPTPQARELVSRRVGVIRELLVSQCVWWLQLLYKDSPREVLTVTLHLFGTNWPLLFYFLSLVGVRE